MKSGSDVIQRPLSFGTGSCATRSFAGESGSPGKWTREQWPPAPELLQAHTASRRSWPSLPRGSARSGHRVRRVRSQRSPRSSLVGVVVGIVQFVAVFRSSSREISHLTASIPPASGRAQVIDFEDGSTARRYLLQISNAYPTVGILFKGLARTLNPELDTARNSSHAARIGATHDLVEVGLPDVAIMRHAGWRTPRMVGMYARGADRLLGALQTSAFAPS